MLEQLKKLQKEKDEAYNKFREAYDKKCEEFNEKLLELLPYEGKCVKIDDDLVRYIKVDSVFRHGDKIIIRGYGFYSAFTAYADYTFVKWDHFMDYEFDIDLIIKKVKCIKIINESEFTNAFNDLINQMKQNHLNTML